MTNWHCESGEGRLPILGSLIIALGACFPTFYFLLELDIWEALFGAAGLGFLVWLNAGPRSKHRFTIDNDSLVVDNLMGGIGNPRKVYSFARMRGQPITLKRNLFFGWSTITVGTGKKAIRLYLYEHEKAEELLSRMNAALRKS